MGARRRQDKAIPPAAERFMYKRANFRKVVEGPTASHVVTMSLCGRVDKGRGGLPAGSRQWLHVRGCHGRSRGSNPAKEGAPYERTVLLGCEAV